MSGGSYNYLCRRDTIALGDLEAVSKRLSELAPDSAAARDTRDLLDRLRGDDMTNPLREVWRAVEWLDSYDEGEDQTREAIALYEELTGKPF